VPLRGFPQRGTAPFDRQSRIFGASGFGVLVRRLRCLSSGQDAQTRFSSKRTPNRKGLPKEAQFELGGAPQQMPKVRLRRPKGIVPPGGRRAAAQGVP